jgi:hypothetical protein
MILCRLGAKTCPVKTGSGASALRSPHDIDAAAPARVQIGALTRAFGARQQFSVEKIAVALAIFFEMLDPCVQHLLDANEFRAQ